MDYKRSVILYHYRETRYLEIKRRYYIICVTLSLESFRRNFIYKVGSPNKLHSHSTYGLRKNFGSHAKHKLITIWPSVS